MANDYDDIINLPRPQSHRPTMPRGDRAAQFSPFAALTGYGAAVEETARLTEGQIELDEDTRARIDAKLHLLADSHGELEAAFTHFVPDARKSGGEYICTVGRVKRLDVIRRTVLLTDGTQIAVERIIDIQ